LIEQEAKELIVEMDTANDEDQLGLTESKAGKRVSSLAMARFNLLEKTRCLLMKKSH